MKPKYIVLVAFIIVIVAAIWVLVNRPETDLDSSEPAPNKSTQKIEPSLKETNTENVIHTGTASEPLKKVEYVVDFIRGEREANEPWRTPIDFYGQVVDENGVAVADAKVVFGLNNLKGHSAIETMSDSAGFFELLNRKGKHLSVRVSKEGYYTSAQNQTGFFYAGRNNNFVPNASNPVLFH